MTGVLFHYLISFVIICRIQSYIPQEYIKENALILESNDYSALFDAFKHKSLAKFKEISYVPDIEDNLEGLL